MARFFVTEDQINADEICLTGMDVNHIKNVLRLGVGQEIIICNGQGQDYYCIIDRVRSGEIIAKIRYAERSKTELRTKIYLFQGLPKKDKMELIIQKAVELGVYEIIPVITKRTIVKLEGKKVNKKLERWQTIAEAAAKQAGRGLIPKVNQVLDFKQALTYAASIETILMPYEKAENMQETKELIQKINPTSVGIFIGPEGGFETSEVALATENRVLPISLGKRILRTETAGLTLLSLLMFKFEEDQHGTKCSNRG